MANDDGNKMFELQQQLRNNSEDLQSFLRDLGSWVKQMEVKDEQLKKKKSEKKSTKHFEPARPTEELKRKTTTLDEKKNDEKKTKVIEQEKKVRISSFDYDAWSKFDVDKAVAEVEDVTAQASEPQEVEMDGEMRVQRAFVEKEKGNECFKVRFF